VITPDAMLDEAERMCRGQSDLPRGVASRSAAFVTRSVLEALAKERVTALSGCAAPQQMRATLACLWGLGEAQIDSWNYGWAALSRMCHLHEFDTTPTAEEVLSLVRLVRGLAP